ncbi:SufE family protein [Alteromonas sp. CYL-A6]|uniref:SufE family protein n=1 Tax=Alteromonas nitratireducens TaxID=3390813 RepID=UPI0034A834F8
MTNSEFQPGPLARSLMAARGWDESVRAIMLAGKSLSVLPESGRQPENRVDGCDSQVWIARCGPADAPFQAYSDSKILRGVLAILLEQANRLSHQQQLTFDYDGFMRACGLERYLSQSRNNGIRHVVARLRSLS